MHWIDFNNFNVLEVCSVQLYYLGSIGLGLGVGRYSIFNDSDQDQGQKNLIGKSPVEMKNKVR